MKKLSAVGLLLIQSPLLFAAVLLEEPQKPDLAYNFLNIKFSAEAPGPSAPGPVVLAAPPSGGAAQPGEKKQLPDAGLPSEDEEEIDLPKPPDKIKDITDKDNKGGGSVNDPEQKSPTDLVYKYAYWGIGIGAAAGAMTAIPSGMAIHAVLAAKYSSGLAIVGAVSSSIGIFAAITALGLGVAMLIGTLKMVGNVLDPNAQ